VRAAQRYCSAYAALAASRRRKQSAMPEITTSARIELKILQSKTIPRATSTCRMTLQPNARCRCRIPRPLGRDHLRTCGHKTTWRVDGKDIDVAPRRNVFIKRGIVHGFANRGRRRRRVFAFSARACSVRSISRTWQLLRSDARSGTDEGDHASATG